MTTTRAADDFPTIRARLEELRRERSRQKVAETEGRGELPRRRDGRLSEPDLRQREKPEGMPPPWVPTVFAKKRAG